MLTVFATLLFSVPGAYAVARLRFKGQAALSRAILRGNDRGGYTVPTAGLFPYRRNWDSAFAAWGIAHVGLPRAWVALETLFSGQ